MPNHVVWFDIPVEDFDRAIAFYSAVLACEIHIEDIPGTKLAVLPHSGNDVAGCIYLSDKLKPADHGVLVYMNVDGRLDDAIAQVEQKGGQIITPKESIAPHGFRAVVLDSEGNRIALHSN